MGAGNTLLRCSDPNRYDPTTFFIEYNPYDEDDQACQDENQLDNIEEDLRESLMSEVCLDRFDESDGKWCAGFGQQAKKILEGKYSALIIADGEWGMALTCVPSFEFEDLKQELYDEHYDKMDWHDARGGYSERIEELTGREWDKQIELFQTEANMIFNLIHGWYPKLRKRDGPWTSSGVGDPNKCKGMYF